MHLSNYNIKLGILAFLAILLAARSEVSAQIQVRQTSAELSFWLPGKSQPAIAFPLGEDWLIAADGKSSIKQRMGSFKLKDHLLKPFRFDAIDSVVTHSERAITVFIQLANGKTKMQAKMLVTHPTEDHLQLKVLPVAESPTTDRLILRYVQSSAAHIFGGGEQFSHLNLQGHKVPMIVEENGIGRGDPKITPFTRLAGVAGNEFSTYCPIPFYMTTEGKGIAVTGGSPSQLDFSKPDRVEIDAMEASLTLDIWQKPQPLDILEAFSAINGRFPILPDWAWGTWLGIQGGAKQVDERVARLQAFGCKLAAIWIQDWVGKRQTQFGSRLQWHWEADTVQYPRIQQWITAKNAAGIKVLGYINPFLKAESHWADSLAQFLVKDIQGLPRLFPVGGFDAFQFELHDPATRKMLAEMIRKNMIDIGFSGWMADFAEWYPVASDSKGNKAKQEGSIAAHNDYPIRWQQVNRMAIESTGHPEDYVYFSRSGYLGAGQYASTYWAGDQMTSWGENDGLPSAVTAMISSGMSGIAINHSDLGGYTNVSNGMLHIDRSFILMERWAEFAAFTPIFRTHEGLLKRDDQVWGLTKPHPGFLRMAKVHDALGDYLKALNVEAHEKGWPMIRHLWLHYPEDPNVLDLKYEYLLGRDILVIPNVWLHTTNDPEKVKVPAYFPEGEWEHLIRSNIQVKGPQSLEVTAWMGCPAVYIRSDSKWKESLQSAIAKAFAEKL